MDDDTTKIIKERFNSLPESIQEVILSSDYENTLLELGKEHSLNVEQLGILERETTLVMMGLTNPDKFESELRHELNIDPQKVSDITKEINEKIFLKIRELLKLMNTPEGEDPVVEETETIIPEPEIVKHEDTDNQILESHGIKIVSPSPSQGEGRDEVKQVENKIPETQNLEITGKVLPMWTQKFIGNVQTEVKKTEHTIENITKATPTIPEPPKAKSYPPKADPYRMSPDE
jgi:hypothetical protein